MRTLAIIPARGGSKRIAHKNRRKFVGTPLIAWSIRFALRMEKFDRVIVSTDDEEIAKIAGREGLPVPFIRPANISGDKASSTSVVRHALEYEAQQGRHYELAALLQPTSPVRLASRWEEAYRLISNEGVDSVVGIAPTRTHPFHTYSLTAEKEIEPFISGGDEIRKLRSQDLPEAYALIGNLYLARTSVLSEADTFFPPNIAGVLCDEPYESMDIDTEVDWVVAETITKHFGRQP